MASQFPDALHWQGVSCHDIAKHFSVGKSTVSEICSGVELDLPPKHLGHPKKISDKMSQHLCRDILSAGAHYAKALHQPTTVNLCTQTLCNAPKHEGLQARAKAIKPLLTRK